MVAFNVKIKLMNLAESFKSPKQGTPEFNDLANNVVNSLNGVLNDIPGYQKTDVTNFVK